MPPLLNPRPSPEVDQLTIPDAPLLATIDHTAKLTGWSRQRIYRLLIAGGLQAVKDGSRTLILWDSVLAYIATLPPAKFSAPRTGTNDAREREPVRQALRIGQRESDA